MPLDYDRYTMEIITQTDHLRTAIENADLTTPVPTCPEWNLGQLARHVGGGQSWAAAAVQRRVQEPLPEDEFQFRDLSAFVDEKSADIDPWLGETSARLSGALAAAGAGLPLWTPVPGVRTSDFYARRFTHEALVHRADATLAIGAEFAVEPDIAADAIDEWLELCSLPDLLEQRPRVRELFGPGRTLHLHATDVPEELEAEWVIDLTGAGITWRRAHERCAVAVRGPLTELLLVIYRRRTPESAAIEVLGDGELFTGWLDRVAFG
ncbi:maleylpyruvate isomerase family mycothiol-dependent enzyme [Nocardia otitidiscaviarum]|uniref:maleylpyruvate isomerase family mycothiol-dependent enzyme n=1 Tax=Nocardia otitidiscaviarum TaxID=1823 RepID=UPI002458DA84|nr:maleylpyruvate isomerase family mycothiol-dependent enzyme [Nocardia otitidiscaviarum]